MIAMVHFHEGPLRLSETLLSSMYSFSPLISEREDEGSCSEVSVCTEEVSEGRFRGRPEGIQGAPGFPLSQPVPLSPQNQRMSHEYIGCQYVSVCLNKQN